MYLVLNQNCLVYYLKTWRSTKTDEWGKEKKIIGEAVKLLMVNLEELQTSRDQVGQRAEIKNDSFIDSVKQMSFPKPHRRHNNKVV